MCGEFGENFAWLESCETGKTKPETCLRVCWSVKETRKGEKNWFFFESLCIVINNHFFTFFHELDRFSFEEIIQKKNKNKAERKENETETQKKELERGKY